MIASNGLEGAANGGKIAKSICDYVEYLEKELAFCRRQLNWLPNVHPYGVLPRG